MPAGWLLLVALARAELAPPDYTTSLTEAAAKEVARVGEEQGAGEAEKFARRWTRAFGPTARVTYELGLAWRLAGDDAHARRFLDEALVLDPELVAARYDRGEIRLADGDLDGAEDDFRVVVRSSPGAWAGWFRMAQIAGQRGDATAFEAHLLRALRTGFQVRAVAQDPTWRSLLQAPEVGPVLERLVLVYQGPEVLRELGEIPRE